MVERDNASNDESDACGGTLHDCTEATISTCHAEGLAQLAQSNVKGAQRGEAIWLMTICRATRGAQMEPAWGGWFGRFGMAGNWFGRPAAGQAGLGNKSERVAAGVS